MSSSRFYTVSKLCNSTGIRLNVVGMVHKLSAVIADKFFNFLLVDKTGERNILIVL